MVSTFRAKVSRDRLRHHRFNKIGNREMYMNCAPINIVPKGSKHLRDAEPQSISPRDTTIANAAAQSALSSYPALFVANLASVNDCVTKETQDVIFDSPGNSVQYADGKSSGGKPSFGKGQCTGKGGKNAGSSSPSSSSPPPSSPGGSSSGDNGQWKDPSSSKSSSKSPQCNDGQWHPECLPGGNGQKALSGSSSSSEDEDESAKKAQSQDSVEDIKTGGQPSGDVEKDLQEYLSTLYDSSEKSKRTDCGSAKRSLHTCTFPNRWVKRSLCLWVCVRKGRSIRRDEGDLQYTLNLQLTTLATEIARLMNFVSQKQSLERRLSYIPDVGLEQPAPQPTTFDLFLTYLSQLQSTVIECIRGIAAAAPVDRKLEAAQVIPTELEIPTEPSIPVEPVAESSPILPTPDAALLELSQPLPTPAGAELLRGPSQGLFPPTPSPVLDPVFASDAVLASGTVEGKKLVAKEKLRRQLLVPDISMLSWLNSIDPSDLSPDTDFGGLVKGLQGIGKDIMKIVDALKVEGEVPKPLVVPKPVVVPVNAPKGAPPIRHGPPVGVVQLFGNGTSSFNETNNPLQMAADRAGFDAAVMKDQMGNTPPFSSTATMTTSTSTSGLPEFSLSTTAALLPYLMGPGPVVPPGVTINWPGPNTYENEDDGVSNLEHFPIVVNDIDDDEEAKEEVRKFFEDLRDDDAVSNVEDFPMVVKDIDKEQEAKEEVRKFFEQLGKGAKEAGGSKDDSA